MEKFLKPREGLIVRDPATKDALPPEGAYKTFIGPQGRYWRRRVKQGDCVEVVQSTKAKRKE